MPGSYLIDVARGIVFSRAWGPLDPRVIELHAATLKADPRFHPSFRQIIDLRGITDLPVSSDDIRGFAAISPFNPDARRAFVVGSDEAFGLSRMYSAYSNASDEHFALFRELGPAMEWVGLDSGTPWPAQPPDKTFEEG